MFNIFKKNKKNSESSLSKLEIKIDNMHCTSCAMNIDAELEELNGVEESSTSYRKSMSVVKYRQDVVSPEQIVDAISKLGYRAII